MNLTTDQKVIILVIVWMLLGGRGGGGGIIAPGTPTLIVMLHETLHGPLPPYAIGAASELTTAGREVRMIDDDLTEGLGEVPPWLKPALEPGRAIMGGSSDEQQVNDALVILAGERVLKAIKLPDTREAVLEACK